MATLTFIIIILVLVFVVIELLKHHFFSKISKLVVLFLLLASILLVSSGYLVESGLIKSENKIVVTSAAIFSDIKKNLEENKVVDFDSINTTKFLDTRKIYK